MAGEDVRDHRGTTETSSRNPVKPLERWAAKDVSVAAKKAACAVDMLCLRFTDLHDLAAASLEMSKVTRTSEEEDDV